MTNNYEITLQQAIDMTTLFRDNQPANTPICETFGVQATNQLLATENCEYLRVYFGMKENKQISLIVVAVNADGQDILPEEAPISSGTVIIVEDGIRCPPTCPPPSKLNGG